MANLTPQNMKYKMFAEMWIKMYKDFKTNPNENDKIFYKAPVVIVVTADSETNGAIASSNMELMTNALGLGTFLVDFL
ncbi:MAG: hypothetical protein WBI07_11955 [Mobilitalea sp.]